MWLLDAGTLELKEFIGAKVPPYAILSHTWDTAEEEISFRDIRKARDAAELKKGYAKIKSCCLQAAQDGYQYVWIDSCCIDKRSSAELSEAINSMYKYYRNAQVCYAYLFDVPSCGADLSREDNYNAFAKSSWFTRGWTLQELIAPRTVQFFGAGWTWIGAKKPGNDGFWHIEESYWTAQPFMLRLALITGISVDVLNCLQEVEQTSVAQRMSWAARRQTTRVEDMAYSLMGLFNIHMPILYDEGEVAAFQRLQLQIIQSIPDQSLFTWRARENSGLLAESPRDFADSSRIEIWHPSIKTVEPWSMTNVGLRVNLHLSRRTDESGKDVILATLRCWTHTEDVFETLSERVQIYLEQIHFTRSDGSVTPVGNLYGRENCDRFIGVDESSDIGTSHDIYVLEDSQFETLVFD